MNSITEYSFLTNLTKLPFIEEIWLFGSRGRGDNHERADIDIAILCPNASKEDWQQVLEIIYDADTLLKIDCVRFDTLNDDDKFKQNIIDFKKILYKKGEILMEKIFWQDYFKTLGQAIQCLHEVIERTKIDKDPIFLDAAIQRFEFVIELFWKVLKKILTYEEIDSTTPRDVMSKAFQFNIIDDEQMWLEILKDRNVTSHVYKYEDAKQVFENIKIYLLILEKTYNKLDKKYFG
ncbi:nucleotidyltransferase substrate binding, HI0074 family protein [Rickettsia felis str. Pedreira]|uniref:Nucleotidyltransferase substrate binding, HI0074 family protein n=2 Tax=Rickettsia felis TaxID=42862 RepID=A0A0F3MQX6_RICFI|nr:HI0074 family nucleotidyltransferase substrate-binding subunit [Rickettsia felis]AAY61180.1 Nucleotidyltransferase domain [Rickettsia felis URRWXCal2]KJV58178.1 nucleotidyltransferase substrate binding, HI0074 family protein [Rickettsia felis str. Pedreira]MDE8611839.1 HI0074 family nucleotidyltransferase substrate-binding subunit [Rickettsia felis]